MLDKGGSIRWEDEQDNRVIGEKQDSWIIGDEQDSRIIGEKQDSRIMGEKEQAGIRKSSGSRDSDFASLQNCTRVGYIVGASKEQSKIQLKCETSFNFPTTVYENRQDHELQDSGHRHTS